MRISELQYTKENDSSKRRIVEMKMSDKYVEGIDLGHLDGQETKLLEDAFAEFEARIAPLVKKAWRRFDRSKITTIPS